MASTNPFLHADTSSIAGQDDEAANSSEGARMRGANSSARVARRKSRVGLRQEKLTGALSNIKEGWPELEGLKPVLKFLAVPALVVLLITITGGEWPKFILYTIAVGLGTAVALSVFKGVELVFAVLLIYLPFSKVFVVPLAPGINGTNTLIVLGFFAAVLRLVSTRQKLTDFPAGAYLVFAFGFLTAMSAFTVTGIPGGRVNLLYNEMLSYKAWIDQFIFYFIALLCIRDVETAKRCVIYSMIGAALVVLYSVPEMLDKGGRSSIEKMRIGGPHQQSNNFGGFVAYTMLPLVAIFIMYIKNWRIWTLLPYFFIAAKVLIMTFSRGAYLAMAGGAFLAAWYKGKGFIAFWTTLVLVFFLVFPSALPDSVVARFDTNNNANSAASAEDRLDKSSSTRLIMWRAASTMILEDPIWGKGFKAFPMIKSDYTEIPVKESDPHSMYLYIGAEMGLPALSLFLVILGYSFWLGRYHAQNEHDKFIRAIGVGGAASTACFAIVCVFGSRAVSLNFTVYFWMYLAVMQIIRQKQLRETAAAKGTRSRTNAFKVARGVEDDAESLNEQGMFAGAEQQKLTALPKGWEKRGVGKLNRVSQRGAAAHQAREEEQQNASSKEKLGSSIVPLRKVAVERPAELPTTVARKSRRGKRRFARD